MSEQPPRESLLPSVNISGAILKVNPENVDNRILDKISTQISRELQQLKDKNSTERVTIIVNEIINMLLKPYLSTRLGGQIVDPRTGDEVIKDRMIQFAELCMRIQENAIDRFIQEFGSGLINAKTIDDKVSELLDTIDISFIVVREIVNRLFVLYQINAPAEFRPPLVNALEGYDVLGGGMNG